MDIQGRKKKNNWSNLDYSACASCLYEVFCRSLGGGRGGGASTTHPIPFFSVAEATQFLLSLTADLLSELSQGNDVSLRSGIFKFIVSLFIMMAYSELYHQCIFSAT